MDDLLLFTPSKESQMNKLEDLLKALLNNGLKISLKKCQLFKTSLQYMGIEIFSSKQKSVCTTLKKQIGGNSKTTTPKTAKGCRRFAGMVI